MISIDIEMAKNIKKETLRLERVPKFQELDVQFQRAQEEGTDTSEIVAAKQVLRDITLKVDECTTVEELKAISIETD